LLDNVKVTSAVEGTLFYDSSLSGPIVTHIGDATNTKAIEKALKSMAKKEKALFRVKSNYAYGAEGFSEWSIPQNTDLIFEIELLSFEKAKVRAVALSY
jgi:FKBP-type peptidyl-prolyl cis-trans isomerase